MKKREIKFRAWNKPTEQMFYENLDFEGAIFELNKAIRSYTEDEQWILMQYTGLKDKNGKEIYEGDIVKVKDKSSGYPFEIGEVSYRDEIEPSYAWGWRINWIGKDKIPQALMVIIGAESIEVIGNIYQDKKLLS